MAGNSEPLLTFSGGLPRDPQVQRWLDSRDGELAVLARSWFAVLRDCGSDVRELMHDGCPTVCVEDAGFAYVNVFSKHVNVGFFLGSALPDPQHLLEGAGKRMRHVKLRPGQTVDEDALRALIVAAYRDICARTA